MVEKPNIIHPNAGKKIKASVYTGNFEKFEEWIDAVVQEVQTKTKEYVVGQMNSLTNTVANIRLIAQPIIRLDNTILDDEIRLEGAEVSRQTYASLFNIYGTAYGVGNGVTTFNLPDFRNRAIWGANDFGYLMAGLPNITGVSNGYCTAGVEPGIDTSGCIYPIPYRTSEGAASNPDWSARFGIDASRSNPIYGRSGTVQPPAIKVRVVTRYK